MNEILNSVKLIKMYAWEDSFEKKIAGMKLGRHSFYISSISNIMLIIYTVPFYKHNLESH